MGRWEMFAIAVKTVRDETMTFFVAHETTIAEVTVLIQDDYHVGGMPTHEQRLMLAGNRLEDHRHILSDYNITAGAVVVMAE